MKSIISLLVIALALTACDDWQNPIATTPAPEKGAMRLSNRDLPIDSSGTACGAGWHHFQAFYGDTIPTLADTTKVFWTGIGFDGRRKYGVLNNGRISYGQNKFLCIMD